MKKEDLKVGMSIINTVNSAYEITAVTDKSCVLKNVHGNEFLQGLHTIEKWTEKKPEPRIEILYECVDYKGISVYLFEDGRIPNLHDKRKDRVHILDISRKKTGRTLKLNMDTWTIVNE